MAEVKWIKLTTTMFDDEKIRLIEGMPEKDTILIIWIKLLVLAGKTNANGYIYLSENIPYTEEMLATLFNRPLNTVRMALEIFKKFGMIETDGGHLIYITNWEKHQNIEGMDKIREQTKKRVAKHRERQKQLEHQIKEGFSESNNKGNVTCNVTVTQSNAIEGEIDIEEDIDIEIDNKDRVIDIDNNTILRIQQAYFDTFYREISHSYLRHILDLLNEGDYADLIIHALKITKERQEKQNQEKNFKYTLAIIESWINKGYKTTNDVLEGEKHGSNRKNAESDSIYKEYYDFSKYGG